MRIVSQCGQADFPYERTYILSDRENVKAVYDGKSYVIGRYSTHEKAIKAMEMCRKQYMDGEYNRNSLSGVAESIGRLSEGREWPVWFEVPQAEETYYRYILPDGSAIVICEYKHYNEWWENKYVPGEPEGTLTVEYLLEPGYKHLHNCKTNQTALIRKLMEVQRNGQ